MKQMALWALGARGKQSSNSETVNSSVLMLGKIEGKENKAAEDEMIR